MKTKAVVLLTVLMGTIGVGGALVGHRWIQQGKPLSFLPKDPEHRLQTLPELRLPDLAGQEFGQSNLEGKVVVLNFWATWCLPCREEIPMFMGFQAERGSDGVQFVGIAIDDAAAVKEFVTTTKINYPVLLGDVDAIELSRRLGNRLQGLPFTAIFDRKGNLIYAQTGPVERAHLEERIGPLLKKDA